MTGESNKDIVIEVVGDEVVVEATKRVDDRTGDLPWDKSAGEKGIKHLLQLGGDVGGEATE